MNARTKKKLASRHGYMKYSNSKAYDSIYSILKNTHGKSEYIEPLIKCAMRIKHHHGDDLTYMHFLHYGYQEYLRKAVFNFIGSN